MSDVATHDHLIRVLYRDTDQMGIVYHANYLVYMEAGRVELLRARNWSYRQMEEAGVRIPVLRVACDFQRPARYDDWVRVHTRLVSATRIKLHFRYELHCDDRGELLATGESFHAFMGPEGRAFRLAPDMLARIRGEA